MIKDIIRIFVNQVLRTRQYQNRVICQIAGKTKGKIILEVGSGKKIKNRYPYSYGHLFAGHNRFIRSDVNHEFGHKILDVTKFEEKDKYDLILCLNVLEHVFEYQKALSNIYCALKRKGQLILSVPFIYPLHDQPNDYWRFSLHSIRKLLINNGFFIIEEKTMGLRDFPIMYIVIAKKSNSILGHTLCSAINIVPYPQFKGCIKKSHAPP